MGTPIINTLKILHSKGVQKLHAKAPFYLSSVKGAYVIVLQAAILRPDDLHR